MNRMVICFLSVAAFLLAVWIKTPRTESEGWILLIGAFTQIMMALMFFENE